MKVFIYGAGRCGRALAATLHETEHTLLGTWNRTQDAADAAGPTPWPRYSGAVPTVMNQADVVWVTVPDDAINEVARLIAPHQIALHAAGAVPAEALRAPDGARAVAACHPLQSYATPLAGAAHSRDIAFGLQGDAVAITAARTLVLSMGARPFVVSSEAHKALYHAACCVASNGLVALMDRAVNLFEAAGMERAEALRALVPLVQGTVDNLSEASEPAEVMTGPLARGDLTTVRRHLSAIERHAPGERDAYKRVCDEIHVTLDKGAPSS